MPFDSFEFVANVSKGQAYDTYVGRDPQYGDPCWGNPYSLRYHSREESVWLYDNIYLPNRPDLLARLPELTGRVLGCHCRPLLCHACVLAARANKMRCETAPHPTRRR